MLQKAYHAPMKTKNLRCYQNTKTKQKLESVKENKRAKNLEKEHNTLSDFDFFPYMQRILFHLLYF